MAGSARCAAMVLGLWTAGCDDHILVTPRWVDAGAFGGVECGLTDAGTLRCEGLETRQGVTTFDGSEGSGGQVCALQPEMAPPVTCQSRRGQPHSLTMTELGAAPVDLVVSDWGHAYVVREDGGVLQWDLVHRTAPVLLEGLPATHSLHGVGWPDGTRDAEARLCGVDQQGATFCADVSTLPGVGPFAEVDAPADDVDSFAVTFYQLIVARGTTVAIDALDEHLDLGAEWGWTELASLSAKYLTACAVSAEGEIVCLDAQPDPTTDTWSSTQVALPAPARSIRVSKDHVCAVLDGGAIACGTAWGSAVEPVTIVSEGPGHPASVF